MPTMERLLCENTEPGVVVFGRVTSYPWWPAIVGRCPSTNTWSDSEERRWVFFFNDDSGAWLKIRDMRPFTEWTKGTMSEINNSNPRYKKHLGKIAGAVTLAEEYMRSPVIPRPLSVYSKELTYAALDMEEPSEAPVEGNVGLRGNTGTASSVGNNGTFGSSTAGIVEGESSRIGGRTGRRLSKRKRPSSSSRPGQASENSQQNGTTQSPMRGEKRHRRARARSGQPGPAREAGSEYVDPVDETAPFEGEMRNRPLSPTFLTLPLKGNQTSSNIAGWKAEGKMTATVDPHIEGMDIEKPEEPKKPEDPGKPSGKYVTVSKQDRLIVRINGVSASGVPTSGAVRETSKSPRKISAHKKRKAESKINGARTLSAAVTDSENSEIRKVIDQPTPEVGAPTSSRGDGGETASETDENSEELPSPVAVKSVEDPAGGTNSKESSAERAQTISVLLNRLSSMEGHVQALQVKMGPRNGQETGEDRSAAALKTAVRTAASSVRCFASSRRFDPGTIEAGINDIWPEPSAEEREAEDAQTASRRERARTIARFLLAAAADPSQK